MYMLRATSPPSFVVVSFPSVFALRSLLHRHSGIGLLGFGEARSIEHMEVINGYVSLVSALQYHFVCYLKHSTIGCLSRKGYFILKVIITLVM